MGRKNDRDRQKRLQRKRNKRSSQRASRRAGADPFGWSSDVPNGFRSHARLPLEVVLCMEACEHLLAGRGPLPGHQRQQLVGATRRAGGVWARLPFELEAFLYDSAPWSLTCADLQPVRHVFEGNESEECFSRLWALALTNEPAVEAFAAGEAETCAHRATRAFQELRECLDNPERVPGNGVGAVVEEIKRHGVGAKLTSAYKKLLLSAVAAVHAPAAQAKAVAQLAADCEKVFEQHSNAHSNTAWWQCGRLFMAEVFTRLSERGCASELAAHPGLVAQLFDPAYASVWMGKHGASDEPLRAVHFHATAGSWLRFLERRIDAGAMPFEDRLRYQIARLKLLRANARFASQLSGAPSPHAPDAAGTRELLQAFEATRAFLAHGVPPASRPLAGELEPALVDFYVDAVSELHCEGAALQTSQALLERHPQDFRLACLCATGALMCGQPDELATLRDRAFQSHVDPQLFARCARIWAGVPQGDKAAAAVRPLLFDRLDREHRKQCLMQLAQQMLRRATSRADYEAGLRHMLPFFERDNFVCRELGERAALESALVFLATMMAPLHGVTLALTESQSQQWVSYAQEIACQSRAGSELAIQGLKAASRGFTLNPAVRRAACARIGDFRPAPAPVPTARTAANRNRPRRRGGKAREGSGKQPSDQPPSDEPRPDRRQADPQHSEQHRSDRPGLFDGIDS